MDILSSAECERDPIGDRTQFQALKQAIDTIASVCDGAREHDDVGFNGADASSGHLLAFLPLALWPPDAFYQAWVLLRKYQRQLAFANILYAELPEPPCLGQEHGGRYIALRETGDFLVLFPSQARLDTAFGRIPGGEKRTAPARHYLVKPVVGSGKALLAFARRNGFQLGPGVAERARLLDYQVLLEESGVFGVYFPRNEEWNTEIKAIPGWSYAYRPRFRWLLPPTRLSAQALRAFLAHHPEFQVMREVEAILQTVDPVPSGPH